MRRIFFDTEFIEDGKTIDLLSIGMIDDVGNTLYLENREADWSKADRWVKDNVITKLKSYNGIDTSYLATKNQIANQILTFAKNRLLFSLYGKVEFWAYYADYDWVVLCQLYGRMIDLPSIFPMYCNDFKQLLHMAGNPHVKKLPEQRAHNALDDAIWLHNAFYSFKREYNTDLYPRT